MWPGLDSRLMHCDALEHGALISWGRDDLERFPPLWQCSVGPGSCPLNMLPQGTQKGHMVHWLWWRPDTPKLWPVLRWLARVQPIICAAVWQVRIALTTLGLWDLCATICAIATLVCVAFLHQVAMSLLPAWLGWVRLNILSSFNTLNLLFWAPISWG